jgi:tetratricopeptide (TPR) repeat protein
MAAHPAASIFIIVIILTLLSPTVRAQNERLDSSMDQLQQAVTAISAGQLSAAEAILTAMLSKSPRDPDALNLLGVVRAQQKRTTEAENLFRRTLTVSPGHVGAHVNLGELYLTTGHTDQAFQILSVAYRLAPDRPDVNFRLAAIYESRGDHENALTHLRRIGTSATNNDYFPLLLKVLLSLKRLPEARALVHEIEKSRDVDPEAQAQCAMLLAASGLRDAALVLLEVARNRAPNSFSAFYASGVVSAEAKQFKQAEDYLTEALRLSPDDVPTLRALARIARAQGELEKSLSHLLHARRLAPQDAGILYDFGATTLQMDLFLDALPAFAELRRRYPGEPAYLYALAAARLRNGEKAEAVRLLKNYIAVRPQDPSGFYLLGAALFGLKQYDEARTFLEKSLGLKADADAEFFLALCLSETGNRKASIESLLRVVQKQPDHAAAHAALGAAYREEGEYEKARVILERAIVLNPEDLRAHYQLGLVYAKLGDKDGAQKMFARADELRGQERKQETLVFKLVDRPQQ